MKMLVCMIVLCLGVPFLGWAQGPIGNYSEDQIMDLIMKARGWTSSSYLNEAQQEQGKKFLREYQPLLNNLGKKEAFYYLKIVESRAERYHGYVTELAYIGRRLYWYHRNEYSPEEKQILERLKNLLSPEPDRRELIDEKAKENADAALSRKHKTGYYFLRKYLKPGDFDLQPENHVPADPAAFVLKTGYETVPGGVTADAKPSTQPQASSPPEVVAFKYAYLAVAAGIVAVAGILGFYLLRRRTK